jgi:hypothetical protein
MNRNVLILVVFFVVIAMGACQKDNGTDGSVKMGAKIDSVQWDTSVRLTVLSSHKFTITGTNALTGGSIVLTTCADTVGTYNLSMPFLAQFNGTYKATYAATAKDTYIGTVGKLKLTKVDTVAKQVSGTFEFKGLNTTLDSIKVTKGAFNDLLYQ